jgi:iduronate 2-sulfatase
MQSIRFLSGVVLFNWFWLGPQARAGDEAPPPNFLVVLVDDLNDWIGAMGGHPGARTPNIDRLAARGTLFANAHCASPLCGPTRAAILTGLSPATTGLYGHTSLAVIKANEVAGRTDLLPEYLRRHGYRTLATGKVFHEGSPPDAFDEVGVAVTDFGPRPAERVAYTPPEGLETQTDWGAFPEKEDGMPDARSAAWAVAQLGRTQPQPFALFVGLIRPHVPWYVPAKWFDRHPLDQVGRPAWRADDLDDLPETARRFAELPMMPRVEWMEEEQRWEKSVQAYLASVSFMDDCAGRILDALERSPYADNTVVILLSDHGYHLGEKGRWSKHTLWERSTRVPFVIARPEDTGGRVSPRPVGHLDLFPTLAALAGLPARHEWEGRSLVPLLDDPVAPGFPAVVSTLGRGNHAVRTGEHRYIRYADGAEELYDHRDDPHEWRNRVGEPGARAIMDGLAAFLPEDDAPADPSALSGLLYNDYLRNLP